MAKFRCEASRVKAAVCKSTWLQSPHKPTQCFSVRINMHMLLCVRLKALAATDEPNFEALCYCHYRSRVMQRRTRILLPGLLPRGLPAPTPLLTLRDPTKGHCPAQPLPPSLVDLPLVSRSQTAQHQPGNSSCMISHLTLSQCHMSSVLGSKLHQEALGSRHTRRMLPQHCRLLLLRRLRHSVTLATTLNGWRLGSKCLRQDRCRLEQMMQLHR